MTAFPLQEFLGMSIDDADGGAVARLAVGPHLLNPNGVVHGAVLFAMVDTAMGRATMDAIPPGLHCASIDVHIRFLRAVRNGSLEARVTVMHAGRRIVHLEGVVTDAEGRKVATATGSFAVLGG